MFVLTPKLFYYNNNIIWVITFVKYFIQLFTEYYLIIIGIHPHEAKSWEDNYYDELKDIAKNPECVAIGICGLDYNKDFSSPDIQRKVFELQVSNYYNLQ